MFTVPQMILALAFCIHQAAQADPPPQGGALRIVAVEQKGKPPYKPEEGRVYRLAGAGLSEVRPGDVVVLKRPGFSKDLGLLRVNTVYGGDSATATLEVRGETFPLKGDLALPISPLGIPGFPEGNGSPLRQDIPLALDPLVMPEFPQQGAAPAMGAAPSVSPPSMPRSMEQLAETMEAEAVAEAEPAQDTADGVPTDSTGGGAGIGAGTGALAAAGGHAPDHAQRQGAGQGAGHGADAGAVRKPPPHPYLSDRGAPGAHPPAPAGASRTTEQHPIYFVKGSSAISPKGLEKIRAWTDTWGKRGLRYYLSVPQNELALEKLTVERLAGLQRELRRLGVQTIEFRSDEAPNRGPYDVVYLGIDR